MVLARGNTSYEIVKGANERVLNKFSDWVQFCMLYSACELPPLFLCLNRVSRMPEVRPMSFISKKLRNGGHLNVRMDQDQSQGFL